MTKKMMVAIMVLASVCVHAGTQRGDVEIGAGVTLSNTSVSADNGASSDTTQLAGNVQLNYFMTDSLSLGVSYAGNVTDSDSTTSGTHFIEGSLRHHFVTEAAYVPYIGVHGGAAIYSANDYTETIPSFGAHAGIKFFVNDNTSFDVQGRWTRYSVDVGGGVDIDQMAMIFGINYKF